ncbi:MAG TPA: hypothetical protein DD379_10215 [Cyanobacteria bacterium UBA11162]|nr:hypothetical protein [Cyanobacteria bacterium UBA11162]
MVVGCLLLVVRCSLLVVCYSVVLCSCVLVVIMQAYNLAISKFQVFISYNKNIRDYISYKHLRE